MRCADLPAALRPAPALRRLAALLADGLAEVSCPVREIDLLRASTHKWEDTALPPGIHTLEEARAELLDISARVDLGHAGRVGLAVRGVPISCDVAKAELTCQGHRIRLPALDRRTHLRVLVDRASIEVFANYGRAYLPIAAVPPAPDHPLAVFVDEGSIRLEGLTVHRLRSIWE